MPLHVKRQEIHGKGYGLFATIDIGAGARIFAEEPLMKLRCDEAIGRAPLRQEVEVFFRMLSDEDRAAINELPTEKPMVQQIITWAEQKVGGWHLASEWESRVGAQILGAAQTYRDESGLYRHVVKSLSLINHSCEPNCRAAYDYVTGEWGLRAIREIGIKEEVTVNYMKGDVEQMLLPTPERRARIKALRGWTCRCVRCVVAQPDRVIVCEQALEVYHGTLQSLPQETEYADNMEAVIEAIDSMIAYSKQLELPELKHKVLDWGLQWAIEKELSIAKRIRRRLLNVMIMAYGDEHPAVCKVRDMDLSACKF